MSEMLIIKTPGNIELIQPTRIGDLQLIHDRRGDVLPLRLLQRDCQPVHQGSHQSLLAGAGGEALYDGVPGESLQTGDTASLSGSERVLLDHPLLDTGEGPELIQDLKTVLLPTIQYTDKYW